MKKLFSAVLFTALMVAPVSFVSCGDDDKDEQLEESGKKDDKDDQDDKNDDGQNGNGSSTQNNPLIGSWLSRDSMKVTETLYWYDDDYKLFEKDYYYDVTVTLQGSVREVSIYRYSYEYDGKRINLPTFGTAVSVTVSENKFSTLTTQWDRVESLPADVLEKIAKGDYVDMDEDDEEEEY